MRQILGDRWTLLVILFALAISVKFTFSQSFDVANEYYQHGLNEKAKETLIATLHATGSTPANKAKALYLLGTISFDEGRIKVALNDWTTLAKDYPQTPEGKEISDRLTQLAELGTKLSDDKITSVVAHNYLSNGDFWSRGETKFKIDDSWLPETEMAVEWYDRVITDFPNSDAAELAFQKKIIALLGSKGVGQNAESYGVVSSFAAYMPRVLETFAALETAYPADSSLPAFRFQIAQAYWGHKDWANTRKWLQTVIDKGNGKDTFYVALAKARLNKIEY